MTGNADFWRGKRVLITGHTGFKGAWLSLWLQALGADVTGYALPPEACSSLFDLCGLRRMIRSVEGDIRDDGMLGSAMAECNPDIVFHMAAQALVRVSYRSPAETFEVNVMGTVRLLEAVRSLQRSRPVAARAVVVVTSDKCYENSGTAMHYAENDRLGGYDPYSGSKACAELAAASYRNSFFPPGEYDSHGVSVATARAGNVIGGGDWAEDRLVPDCIRAYLAGGKLKIRRPDAIRPWQHVLEPLSGYIRLAQRMISDGSRYSQAWNFGPRHSDAQPVENVVRMLGAKWGKRAFYEIDAPHGPHEERYLMLDCSKARRELMWMPVWNLDQTLDRVVEWVQVYRGKREMAPECLRQIALHGKEKPEGGEGG